MNDVAAAIRECVRERKSFLLDAGAGAGKTYSLVEALRYICDDAGADLRASGQSIACITYTNVAKDEVIERTGNTPLVHASTIHDFLWSAIQPHQLALKRALQSANAALPDRSSRKVDPEALRDALSREAITYSDRGSNFLEGRLWHDDVLNVAREMFEANPLLSRLVAARYPYILVDEYQDSSAAVMAMLDILLTNVPGLVVGLFGDKMQNIYHGGEHPGVGEVPTKFVQKLVRIVKGDNRRCSTAVIEVLNRIRTDIKQFPAADNVPGDAVYVNVNGLAPAEGLLRAHAALESRDGWNGATPRELFLTHKLIAQSCGYQSLLEIFAGRGGFARDQFLAGDDPEIAFFIRKIEPVAEAWARGDSARTLSLLATAGYDLATAGGKSATTSTLDSLCAAQLTGSVRDVLECLLEGRLLDVPESLVERMKNPSGSSTKEPVDADDAERRERERTFYDSLLKLPYLQIRAFATFLLEHTPFATKHGVKGAEFDTVYVVLDDAGANWNLYSFDKYLSGDSSGKNEQRFLRTRNLFYVCCSRAKRNLAVIDLGARSPAKDAGVEALFGAEHCIRL